MSDVTVRVTEKNQHKIIFSRVERNDLFALLALALAHKHIPSRETRNTKHFNSILIRCDKLSVAKIMINLIYFANINEHLSSDGNRLSISLDAKPIHIVHIQMF